MNTDDLFAKTPESRLLRIKKASRLAQLFIGFCMLLGVYSMLAFVFHWPFFSRDQMRIAVSQGHVYSSPTEIPSAIFALWLVKLGLGIACAVVLFALFQLYARGILFSSRNVLFIRFLGYGLIINWAVDYQMQAQLQDMSLSMTPVFVGLLIIFFAWIMDEGRKIQEEQELTV